MRVTDAQIIAAYEDTGSVKKAGALLGLNGSSVHERLQKLGASRPINVFTKEDCARLEREYHIYANAGKLGVLAASMGRTKPFIARQAKRLGLTVRNRARPYCATWKYITHEAAEILWEEFKAARLGLGQFCRKKGLDDLGFSRAMRERFPDEYEHVIELKAPKGTAYRYGREFEYRVRDHLKKVGFFALRSPASKSPIDILAVKPGVVLMVQAKRSGRLPPSEWNELYDLAVSTGSMPVMAMEARGNRGVSYFLLGDRKDGSRGPQPMTEFLP